MHLLQISFIAFPLLFLSVCAENVRQERQLMGGNFGNQKRLAKRQLITVSSTRDGGGPQKHTRVKFMEKSLVNLDTDNQGGGNGGKRNTDVSFMGKSLVKFDTDGQSGGSSTKSRQRRQLISVSSSGGGGPKKTTDVNVMGASVGKFETDAQAASSSKSGHRLRRATQAQTKPQEPIVSFSSSGTGAGQQRNVEFMGKPLVRFSGNDKDPLNLKGLMGNGTDPLNLKGLVGPGKDPLNLKGLVGQVGQIGQGLPKDLVNIPTLVDFLAPIVANVSTYATEMSTRLTSQLGSSFTGLTPGGPSGIAKSKYNPLKPQKPKVCDGPFCDIMERGT